MIENIFNTKGRNPDEIAENYTWSAGSPSESPLNITAIGNGAQKGTAISFTYQRVVLFLRWLGQTSLPYAECAFQCYLFWFDPSSKESHADVVGEGVFIPISFEADSARSVLAEGSKATS